MNVNEASNPITTTQDFTVCKTGTSLVLGGEPEAGTLYAINGFNEKSPERETQFEVGVDDRNPHHDRGERSKDSKVAYVDSMCTVLTHLFSCRFCLNLRR